MADNINKTQIRAALDKERQKLTRQEAAADATRGMIQLLEVQLTEDAKPAKR